MDKPVFAVVLAAGSSSRFGSTKQLAEINGTPLVQQALNLAIEVCGDKTVLVTPGLLSLTQLYFLLQKLHWILHFGATGRCTLPNLFRALKLKQGCLSLSTIPLISICLFLLFKIT